MIFISLFCSILTDTLLRCEVSSVMGQTFRVYFPLRDVGCTMGGMMYFIFGLDITMLQIISSILIIKPTRCINFSFIFGIELYMFRTGFLSIIRSLSLYTQQYEYVLQILLTAC